jgi:hypothetical protein
VGGRVTRRYHFLDIDLSLREESCQVVDNARLVQCDHLDTIGQQVIGGLSLRGATGRNYQPEPFFQPRYLALELGNIVPVTSPSADSTSWLFFEAVFSFMNLYSRWSVIAAGSGSFKFTIIAVT